MITLLLKRHQSVLIVAVRPHHSTAPPTSLVKVKGDFKLTLLAYECQHGEALSYLADEVDTSQLDYYDQKQITISITLTGKISQIRNTLGEA